MKLITETLDKQQQVLIVDSKSTPLSPLLKSELKKYNAQIYLSSQSPKDLTSFDVIFFINQSFPPQLRRLNDKTIVVIFVNNKKKAEEEQRMAKNIKVVHLNSYFVNNDHLDRIFWFVFSKSKETFLNLELLPSNQNAKKEKLKKNPNRTHFFTKKRLIAFGIGVFLIYHLMIFPFLGISAYYFSAAVTELKKENLQRAKKLTYNGMQANTIASSLYVLSRPSYLFFSLALFPDSLIDINNQTGTILNQSLNLYDNSAEVLRLIFKKGKSTAERELLLLRLKKLTLQADLLENNLTVLMQKLPPTSSRFSAIRSELTTASDVIKKSKKILPLIENLLAKNTEKKYLLLFANNMELRPGGGFIGSFGILTMKELTFENLEVFDVYTADGQLIEHIEPPLPIRNYLNQPNWFLRDSAFFSDFSKTYNQAKFFLEKEIHLTEFSGGLLLTTTAIQNLLKPFGNIYLSDFNENVNSDNFYIKAQLYSEKDFFPGSIQKKSFLSSLSRQMLIAVDTVSPIHLAQAIRKSFDEKQLVAVFEDSNIQNVIDSLYWSGKTIVLQCPKAAKDCVTDYLMPVDANLGVNKANFFVSRLIRQEIHIDQSGNIHNIFSLTLKNDSPNEVFPGGTYKNYFQLLLPYNSTIKQVTKDGILVENYDLTSDIYTKLGFLVEIPPQSSSVIKVTYDLGTAIKPGHHIYQLVVEKQIGSKNSDLNLELILPHNIHLTDQNFSPLVKENHILYNTNLTADKIFLFEFQKDD